MFFFYTLVIMQLYTRASVCVFLSFPSQEVFLKTTDCVLAMHFGLLRNLPRLSSIITVDCQSNNPLLMILKDKHKELTITAVSFSWLRYIPLSNFPAAAQEMCRHHYISILK